MVNLNLYKCFYTVAKEKNISKASEVLFVSQPAVSFEIKELEKELDQTLFVRKSKGVELTAFGNVLYNKICLLMPRFDEVEKLAQNFKKLDDGILRIGANSSNVNQILLEYLCLFVNKYPNVQIYMTRGTSEKLTEQLANNELDMIFVDKTNNMADFEIIKMYDVKYQLIGNAYYKKKYPSKSLDIQNFPTQDIILPSINNNSRITLNNFFNKNKIEPKPKYELDNYILLYEFVKNGFGVAFVSKEYYKDAIANGEVEVIFPDFSINAREIVCLTSKQISNNALERFVNIVKTS